MHLNHPRPDAAVWMAAVLLLLLLPHTRADFHKNFITITFSSRQ